MTTTPTNSAAADELLDAVAPLGEDESAELDELAELGDDVDSLDDLDDVDDAADSDDLDDDVEDEDDDEYEEDDDDEDGDVELIVLGMAGTTVADDGEEIPGAVAVIEELREAGASVALITDLPPAERDAALDTLGWHGLADIVLSPADAGRGRPYPDLPLTALLRTGASAVDAMVVVGDTVSDIETGVNAGAGFVVGVLSGRHDRDALEDAGADAVIESVADLPALLGLRGE